MNRKTTLHQLSSGIPLLLMENHEVPVATADVWVRSGAADELPQLAGVAHFLEHMMFKGTERYGLGEIERVLESVGGVCNAGTSYDFTHYYVTLPAATISTGVEMLAEMMRHSVLDEGEIEKERLVILEEYRRKLDHPQGVLFERLWPELFESGPYHHSVIGTEETIKAIDRPGMQDYYRKRYAMGSLALVLAGDFETGAMIEQAERAFAGFERTAEVVHDYGPVRYGRGKRIHIDKATGGETYVAFAFPAPGLANPDAILPLDVAQTILGGGRASRLYQSLKEKQGLCSGIMSYFPTQMRDSLFVVAATCRPDQVDPLRAALAEELEGFAATAPDEAAMRRALRLMSSAHLFSMETSGGATSNIGYYYTLTGGTAFLDDYLERLEAVTADQVREAMRGVLGLDGEGWALSDAMVEISVGQDEKK